jgi:hypothetical protein
MNFLTSRGAVSEEGLELADGDPARYAHNDQRVDQVVRELHMDVARPR